MASEQLNTKWGPKDKLELDKLCDWLGMGGEYFGKYPKALKFAVSFTLESLTRMEKVIPDLSESKWLMMVSSIKRLKCEKEKAVNELKM